MRRVMLNVMASGSSAAMRSQYIVDGLDERSPGAVCDLIETGLKE